jgi:DNA topoisomerase-1
MAKNLVIVESPAKARTIEKFLGKDYDVQASFGHIRDLPKDDNAIVIEKNFTPQYVVPNEKAEVVQKLKKLADKADTVWLATDEDREGEAISWHLSEVLDLDPKATKRIVFHEITKKAIQEAIQKPRTIDMDLVFAQQARRVLDRLVGFELSPILWKKVKFGLSAGRVQSVAVRLIVEREREIIAFKATSAYKVSADLIAPSKKSFKAELPKKLDGHATAEDFLKACVGAGYRVASVEVKPGKRTPAAPFTTSTLQQEASRKLGISVAQTMRLAQGLYEAGHITYMRTDSVTLSQEALAAAEANIKAQFGDGYHKLRQYTNKIANAQEAHEAIRPTDFGARTVSGDRNEQRLYELIWKRTLASQMADAALEKTVAEIAIDTKSGKQLPNLVATGEVVKFDGFLKLYIESKDEDAEDEGDSGLLPPLAVGDKPALEVMRAAEVFTRPPSRYTEASLVKKLEELGIGRPSTYAPTISTIINRNYIAKEDREGVQRSLHILELKKDKIAAHTDTETTGAERAKLFPADLGMLVTDFLVQYFPDIVDYSFTARVEEEFDEISVGKLKWNKMLAEFYPPFKKKVDSTTKTAERVSGERVLGKDPASGKPILVRLGKYGPIAQIGDQEDENKKFASLRVGQRIETVTLEQALELFKLPRIVGKYEELPVQANIGRFGPYLLHNSKFYSIPKELDPLDITLKQAIEVIEAKRKAERERVIAVFNDGAIQVLNGRWGPYIANGDQNVKIPKDVDAKKLKLDDVMKLIEAAAANPQPARGRWGRRNAQGKTQGNAAPKTGAATKGKKGGAAAPQAVTAPAGPRTPRTGSTKATAKAKADQKAKQTVKKAAAKKPAAKAPAKKGTTVKQALGKKATKKK